ncbi:sodium:calcium antiporter [Candidatus Woesearchaeota archaeon]|nr:sodium:calcium antiporter [Candidatus Woesearchaeota archaeon]
MVLGYITQFGVNHPLLFLIIIIIASLAILVKSADFLVYGITRYASKLGISDYLIGLIVVALGASLPELVSSLMGSIAGESGIIFGTILGSNVGGFTFVLGLVSVFGKKIKTNKKVLEKTGVVTFCVMMLPLIFMTNGVLSRVEGVILISAFLGYNYYIYKKEGKMGKIKKDVKLERIWRDAIIAVIALLAIILSGRWLVFSSINISKMFGISPYILAIIVIGIAAQIPDLAVSLRAIKQGHQDIAFGDILGSSVVQLLLFFGIFAVISPLKMSVTTLLPAMIFMVVGLSMALLFARKGYMYRKQGIVLIITYALFLTSVVVFR